jgi:hypothetical protein
VDDLAREGALVLGEEGTKVLTHAAPQKWKCAPSPKYSIRSL